MITQKEQEMIARARERDREAFESARILVREKLSKSQARSAASRYPLPKFPRVTSITPYDPWADFRPLTSDEHRAAYNHDRELRNVPPSSWVNVPPPARALFAGLVRLVVETFPRDDGKVPIRFRQPRMSGAVHVALQAAVSEKDVAAVEALKKMYDYPGDPSIVDAFIGLDRAIWLATKRELEIHGGETHFTRALVGKFDQPAGALDKLIAAFKALLAAGVPGTPDRESREVRGRA
jgi:hypothetical protein